MISGVCRCVPPTAYADADPMISLAMSSGFAALPAPEVPTARIATRSSGSIDPALNGGGEAESDGCDVAARNRDARRTDEVLALGAAALQRQLGKPVRPRAEVVAAVERRPRGRVGEPVIGAAVDDEGRRIQLGGQLPRLAVRQRQEHDVVPGEVLGRRVDEHEVGERAQVWLHARQRLAGVRERRHRGDVELGVGCEQSQNLTAGIAACACNGDG